MEKIIQCVPNFSEGRDLIKIEKILDCFRGKEGVKLLDYSPDEDHNRVVVTVVGTPEGLKKSVVDAVGTAKDLIDLRSHKGQHPRMGATDVVPFIPIKGVTMEEAVALSKEVAQEVYEKHGVPVFLYEKSASASHRENLANLRKGEFEGMAEKVTKPEFIPDFGTMIHESAGITAIGARMPLVAFNVNLATDDIKVADKIAKAVRHLSGGLRYCKALGIELQDRGIVQVSMNMTDYTKTPLYRVFEMIKVEAQRYGVNVVGSEIVGLVPMDALMSAADFYLRLEEFSSNQILEKRIME